MNSSTGAWSEAGEAREIPHIMARSFTEIFTTSIGRGSNPVDLLQDLITPSACKQRVCPLESTCRDMAQTWSKTLIRKLTGQMEHSKLTCLMGHGHQGHQQISVHYHWSQKSMETTELCLSYSNTDSRHDCLYGSDTAQTQAHCSLQEYNGAMQIIWQHRCIHICRR